MSNKKLIKSGLLIALALFITRFLGLIREAVLASAYGASSESDAFIIAFTMPNIILACIGTSIGTAYIPLYEKIKRYDRNIFTSNVINTVFCLGIILTIIFSLNPAILVTLFASGADEKTFFLATTLTRIMMLSTIPILLFNILKSYLQIHQAFFVSTVLDGIINLFVIIGIITSKYYDTISYMAYTTVFGNIVCFSLLLYFCLKRGFKYNFYINIKDSNINNMLVLLVPIFINNIVLELNMIIDRNFASALTDGTISSMNYANKINGIIYSFMSTVIVTALYPKLSKMISMNEVEKVKDILNRSILLLGYIILPISVIMFFEANPIVQILFQRGSFSSDNSIMTAQCVQMYAIGYLATNVNPLLSRIFYIFDDSKTPMLNSMLAVLINVIFNFILVGEFKHIGLSISTSVAAIITTLLLLYKIKNKLGNMNYYFLFKEFVKIVCSCTIMSIFFIIIYKYIGDIIMNNTITGFLLFIIVTIIALSIYMISTLFIRVEIIKDVKTILLSKIKRV